MNGSLDGSAQKGAIPKVKVANRLPEQAPPADNNNSRRSLYSDEEDAPDGGRQRSSPRPSTSTPAVRPVTLNCASRWKRDDVSSQQQGEKDVSDCDMDLNVLPRQLLQDLCSLNGDCDICGRATNGKYKACHLNGDERTDGEDSDDEDEGDDEGAVGGDEELLMEVLPVRSSPDSGEGEMDTHKSRSPSCSWDQQSISSGDECFYRYRGEDDEPVPPAPVVHLPPEQAERHRSSSPEMDYLEMDFDPSSDWAADEAAALVDEEQPPEPVLPPVNIPTPEPVVAPVPERNPTPPPVPVLRLPVRVSRVEQCREIMIWSQDRAAELMQPSSNSLYAAANTIFYTLTALNCEISRESVVTYLNEAHPLQSVPNTVVGYLQHRASHTVVCSPSQTHPIFSGPDVARAFGIISHGRLRARFFPVLSRNLQNSGNICRLLTLWLNRGVIPIVTFSFAPMDSSRHEMVFGANSSGIFTMADPNHVQSEQALQQRLAEQGMTTVSHADVLSRYSRDQNLQSLLHTTCLPWVTNNILGTIVGILRAKSFSNLSPSPTSPGSSHQHYQHPPLTFTLPLLCVSGITLVYPSTSRHSSTIESMQSASLSE